MLLLPLFAYLTIALAQSSPTFTARLIASNRISFLTSAPASANPTVTSLSANFTTSIYTTTTRNFPLTVSQFGVPSVTYGASITAPTQTFTMYIADTSVGECTLVPTGSPVVASSTYLVSATPTLMNAAWVDDGSDPGSWSCTSNQYMSGLVAWTTAA